MIVVALLISGCGPAAVTQYPSYQYRLAMPTQPVAPNELLHLAWEPQLGPQRDSAIADVQLCVALFGPWGTVDALKTAIASAVPAKCPPDGALVASDTIRTTSASGARFTADLTAPSAPGFYDLHQISIDSSATAYGGRGGSMSASGIIEVRPR